MNGPFTTWLEGVREKKEAFTVRDQCKLFGCINLEPHTHERRCTCGLLFATEERLRVHLEAFFDEAYRQTQRRLEAMLFGPH